MAYKVLIIEDEAPARQLLKNYLEGNTRFQLVGEYENGFEGLKGIQDNNPDLIILDIQMPKLTGFELLELLDNTPRIIFTTAYDQYAIKAFEYNAIDYLLKPFTRERFLKAIEKASEQIGKQCKSAGNYKKLIDHVANDVEFLNRIVVKSGSKIHVIPVGNIHYFEAQDDYVMIYTGDKKHLKQTRMKYLEEHLNPNDFIRIHRSYIVKVDQIQKLELYEKDTYMVILKSGASIRASVSGYKKLKGILNF
ncbi:MAG: LytR/AlgR family response regulator transcription factor [Bacteroidota bacterium]